MKPLVILGSARAEGETKRAVDIALAQNSDVIELSQYRIGGYDYAHANDGDDFRQVVAAMLAHDHIVFATPVYWFAMSGPLKTFFDRLTDLLETDKANGRAIKGKTVWPIATGTEEGLPEGFEVPFHRTAQYFDMMYRGCGYLYTGKDVSLRAQSEAALAAFGTAISSSGD